MITLSSIGLGAFIGFIITVILGIIYPGVGHIFGGFIGGLIAGLIARGIIGGAIAGFLAGVLSAITLSILAFLGFVVYGGITRVTWLTVRWLSRLSTRYHSPHTGRIWLGDFSSRRLNRRRINKIKALTYRA